MQRHQLFNSLSLSLTAAVLATQPAWANTIQISAVKLKPTASGIEVILETQSKVSPPVFTSNDGKTLVADIINSQLRLPPGESFRQDNPTDDIAAITVTPLNANSIRVSVIGKTAVPVAQVVGSDKGVVLSLTTTSETRPPGSDNPGEGSTISKQQLQDIVRTTPSRATTSKTTNLGNSQSAKRESIPSGLTAQSASESRPSLPSHPGDDSIISEQQLQDIVRTTPSRATPSKTTNLANSQSAKRESIPSGLTAQSLSSSRPSFPSHPGDNSIISKQQLQDIVRSAPRSGTPSTSPINITNVARSLSAKPERIASGLAAQSPSSTPTPPPKPADSRDRDKKPAPEFLNPSPNPLQFPIKPEQVQIQRTEPITLQQAFDLARRNNRELQVAELTLERSRASLREAQAALYPTLNATAGIERQQSANSSFSSGFPNRFSLDQPTTSASGNLALNYNLFTAGERPARIRSAEEQLRFNELDVERQLEQLRLDVATDYYSLQAADEQVRINESAVANAQASLNDARALEQAGLGTRFDVLRSEVQLANARQDLTNARSQQLTARRQLVRRLSLAQSVDVTTADPVQIAGLWQRSLEDSIVLAFQNRAELAQQLAQRNIGEQNRRIALSALKPRVNLSASYNVLNVFQDFQGFGDGYTVGANLSLNLFDAGAARARAAQAEADIALAETRFADTRSQIRFQVEQAFFNLQSNSDNIQTSLVAREQAREALRLARLRFQAGVGTQTDVIAAENDFTRAEGNVVNAILNYNRALISLERAVSTGQTRR